MPHFLVEAYFSPLEPSGDSTRLDDLAETARALAREGREIRLVSTLVLPEDEICLYVFEAGSRDAVSELAARAGLRFERLLEGVSARTFPRARASTPISSRSASGRPDATEAAR